MNFKQLYKMLMEAEARERNLEKKDRKKLNEKKKVKRKMAQASKRRNRK